MAEPGLLVSTGRQGLDQSRDADIKEGAYGRPQVISEKFPTAIPLWSNQRDRVNHSRYMVRQILAAPSSVVEWTQLGAVPLIGTAIKYIVWSCWIAWGYYAIIPAVILIGSILGLLASGVLDKYTRVSTIFKFVLVCSGVAL